MKYIKTPFVDAYTKEENIQNGRMNPYSNMDIHWIENRKSQSFIWGTVPDGTKVTFGEELSESNFVKEVSDKIKNSGIYKATQERIAEIENDSDRDSFSEELENVKNRKDLKELLSKLDDKYPEEEDED